MKHADLAAYASAEVQPLEDSLGARTYRCAARLTDGLYLPCVVLESAAARVGLAIRRFEETIADSRGSLLPRRRKFHGLTYRDIVATFAASGNHLNHFDIASVEPSPFAIPAARLAEVRGETSMAWTQFTGVMRDGAEFTFGTSFLMEFFQMPQGYIDTDVAGVVSHRQSSTKIFRERPFFRCFVEGL